MLVSRLRRRVRLLRREAEARAASASAARDRNLPLLDWTRRYLPHTVTREPSAFHVWLAAELDRLNAARDARLNVQAPRGSAKSTFASLAYPLREALEGRERFVAVCSDTDDQAKDFMEAIRTQLAENELILRDYPEAAGKGPVWRDKRIRLRNGCELIALGSGGKIRGRKSAENRRPSLILLDDPQNKDHIFSDTKRDRSWQWLTKDVLSAGDAGTNVVVLGTALHREAIVCRLETMPAWSSRRWQSVLSWPVNMHLWEEWEGRLHDYSLPSAEARTAAALEFYRSRKAEMDEGAEVLWPAKKDLYALMLKRASDGHGAFQSEEMNDPLSPDTCEWVSYLDRADLWFDEWPPFDQLPIRVIGVDPSKGKNDRVGDYSAVVLFGVDRRGVEYVEAVQMRRPVDALCEEIVAQVARFHPHSVALETNQFQELLLYPLRLAKTRAGATDPMPVGHFDHHGESKEFRLRKLTQSLVKRSLRFKARSPGTQLLLEQMREFPVGRHDDGIDGLQVARERALELDGRLPVKRKVSAV